MENNNTCARCGYKSENRIFYDAHKLAHEARIIRFEKLKTHFSVSMTESRSQTDSTNWQIAMNLIDDVINECPGCMKLKCECNPELEAQILERLGGEGELLREGP